MSTPLPARIDLDGGTHLRQLTPDDAACVARAVAESLDHLRPWMPWADEQSTKVSFQRERLEGLATKVAAREEWQYGLFGANASQMLGSFGLMTRRGPGTFEIGYWVHVESIGKGHATRAAGALTDLSLTIEGVTSVTICCDEQNTRSAAIPRRLGYVLERVDDRPPEAPSESGRLMIWVRRRTTRATQK